MVPKGTCERFLVEGTLELSRGREATALAVILGRSEDASPNHLRRFHAFLLECVKFRLLPISYQRVRLVELRESILSFFSAVCVT